MSVCMHSSHAVCMYAIIKITALCEPHLHRHELKRIVTRPEGFLQFLFPVEFSSFESIVVI